GGVPVAPAPRARGRRVAGTRAGGRARGVAAREGGGAARAEVEDRAGLVAPIALRADEVRERHRGPDYTAVATRAGRDAWARTRRRTARAAIPRGSREIGRGILFCWNRRADDRFVEKGARGRERLPRGRRRDGRADPRPRLGADAARPP